ncbi:MAG TPA: hypothetical protein VFK78_10140 [Gemmatimonadales bacterium]|nr:hypothetical protein [Gemmatimonadales bacterium]
MKRLALVMALVAMGACKKADQQPAAQAPAMDTTKATATDTSKMGAMNMADTSKKMADTTKKAAPAPAKKKP